MTATKKPTAKKSNSKPSNLAYSRSLAPTDAVFAARLGDQVVPVLVLNKTALGTHSQFVEDGRETKDYANPQRVTYATLPIESDRLVISWGLTVVAASKQPHTCENPEWGQHLIDFVGAYSKDNGFLELARRYAINIANGRWAWTNRFHAAGMTVKVSAPDVGAVFEFDAKSFKLGAFDQQKHPSWGDIVKLGDLIAAALRGDDDLPLRLNITGEITMTAGAVVYPSQEFVDSDDDRSDTAKYEAKKVLYGVMAHGVDNCAAFHEQKIGNALRTIDTWHEGAFDPDTGVVHFEAGSPIPVNPYGQIREKFLKARPRAQKQDLYSLLIKGFKDPTSLTEADQHFIVANLIRGGVFGMGKANGGGNEAGE